MDHLFKKLGQYWDLALGRYQVFLVENESDRQVCLDILEAVRKVELNRVSGESVLESTAFSGEKLHYELVGCRDSKTGEVIGCVRLTPAREVKHLQASRDEYLLDRIPEAFIDHLTICTRFAVLKSYRKTPVAMLIMAHSIKHVLEQGSLGALSVCEPNLYSNYKKLGLRPLGALHNVSSGGYRLPLIFMPDLNYLESIHSPALKWKKGVDFIKYEPICQWFRQYQATHGSQEIGFHDYEPAFDPSEMHLSLTKGMSNSGMKEFMQHALVVRCHKNDLVLAEHDGSNGLGLVLQGKVQVVAGGKKLADIAPGEVFGEMAMVLNTRRTASILADADDTEVLLFSVSAFQRLEKPADQTVFWHNIAVILANKLLEVRK